MVLAYMYDDLRLLSSSSGPPAELTWEVGASPQHQVLPELQTEHQRQNTKLIQAKTEVSDQVSIFEILINAKKKETEYRKS